MQKISPCLLLNDQAEEAAKFYTSTFKNSKIKAVTHYGDHGPMPKGTVLSVVFDIEGQEFMAVNGGSDIEFTPAVSMMIHCKTQGEIDEMWDRLTRDGGAEIQCGWVRDKYGLAWQVVPEILNDLLTKGGPSKTNSVMNAVVKMKKLDIATMQKAYDAG